MASLLQTAQGVLDLYNQDFAGDDAFINLDTVAPLVYSEWRRMILEEFRQEKLLARTIEGWPGVTIDEDLLTREVIEVQKDDESEVYYASLSRSVLSFRWDSMGSGVQRVRNVGDRCKTNELVRIKPEEAWIVCQASMPAGKTLYYSETLSVSEGCRATTRLVFIGKCIPKKVDAHYVPSFDADNGDAWIGYERVKQITDSVLQTLLIAKQGVVIDKTNDGNRNTAQATELNPDNTKANP